MRKVINGRTYNTETAKKLGNWNNGMSRLDEKYVSETLFKNTKGAYFILGEGGPMSIFKNLQPGNMRSGEHILPMSDEEALTWATKHLNVEDYEKAFSLLEPTGQSVKGREMVPYSLPSNLVSALRQYRKETGANMSRMVEKAVLQVYGEVLKKYL